MCVFVKNKVENLNQTVVAVLINQMGFKLKPKLDAAVEFLSGYPK